MTEWPLEIALQNPLREVTRKERKMLLSVSTLAIFVMKTGLVPSKISTLGIELERTDQVALQGTLAFVVMYFLGAFLLYGLTDFLAWRITYNESAMVAYREAFARLLRGKPSDQTAEAIPKEWIEKWPNRIAYPASCARAFFEFVLPILIGVYAIYALVCTPA